MSGTSMRPICGPISKRLKRDSDSGRPSTTGLPTAHARVPEERGGGAPTRLSWKWPVAALATLAVAAVLFVVFRSPLAPPQVVATRQITNDQKSKLKEGGVPPPPLLTDGSRIYLQEDTYATNMILAQVSPNGGETSPIALPLPLASPDVSPGIQALSPDGREIFFQADAGQTSTRKAPLWALPLPPGQARRVGNLDVSGATWSPDGASIVYTQDDGVYQARPDGSDSRKLATVSGLALWPRWSPDGRVVRFSVWNTTLFSSTLWEVNADGSNLHQMLADWRPPVNDCCGNWTRDGNYFVFQSTRDGRASLWATRERLHFWQKASAEPAPLAVGQMQAFAPLPSRDGREVYFIGAIMRGELARLDLKTHQFAPYLGGLSAEGLAFSRDGTRVAYVSYPDGVLWVSNVDQTARRQITFAPMSVGLPAWAPDGTQVAFAARRPGQPWQVYRVSATGGSPEPALPGEGTQVDPSWSPDGRSIVFGRRDPEARDSAGDALFIGDLQTHEIAPIPGSAHYFSPRWSPDGRYILAMTADFARLSLFDVRAGTWSPLLDAPSGYPTWSKDSRYVYYSDPFDSRRLPFYRVSVADRKVEHLVNVGEYGQVALGQFGWWTGLGPDDSLLFLRDISLQEVYALQWKLP